jgi:glycosyltransferase involved in cell wall biosynthesis
MKVLHLASWFPYEQDPYNGDFIQRHLKALSLFTPVTVIYVVKDSGLSPGRFHIKKTEINIHYKEWIVTYGTLKTGVKYLDKLLSFIRYKNIFSKLIQEYIDEEGRPDLIHVHVTMNAGIAATKFWRKYKIPYVVTEHSSIYIKSATDNLWNRSAYFGRLTKYILKNAEMVMPVSSDLGKAISAFVHLKRVQVISNTVDTEAFFYHHFNNDKIFKFIHVSGMSNEKNIYGLLRSLTMLKEKRSNWVCTMVGPAKVEQISYAEKLGLNAHLIWKGEVSYQEVALLMQQSHSHLLFSDYETQSCVTLEAMCCGLPVIATSVGGLKEIVNSYNGILVPSNNETALAEAMETMINEYDRFDRKKLSEEASSKFSYETIGKQLADCYEKLLSISNANHD